MKNKKSEVSSSTYRYIQISNLELILRGSYANIGFLLFTLIFLTIIASWI